MKTKVDGYICPKCSSLVFSRTRHDYRPCPCGDIAVDGGFEYNRVTYKHASPKHTIYEIDVSKRELYDDWNRRFDRYGVVLEYSKTEDTSSS